MSRPSPVSLCFAVAGLIVAIAVPVSAAGPTAQPTAKVSVPSTTTRGHLTAITITLSSDVAAIDGRVLVAKGAAEVIGVAPLTGGTGLRPEAVNGGFAFGAYGLKAFGGKVVVQVVINPLKSGHLSLRVLIDSKASATGTRIGSTSAAAGSVGVSGSSRLLPAPSVASVPSFAPTRAATGIRKLVGFGKINSSDVDTARLAWDEARAQGTVCGTSPNGDANDDGCVDIVDIQALKAAVGTRAAVVTHPRMSSASAAAIAGTTFTVNTSGDRVDANIGNGICADSQGNCSLRAAIQEADWRHR